MKDEEKYLEDEMEKFGERWPYPVSFDGSDKDWVDELAEECAKHFYELGRKDEREQMMKEAVEGEVIKTDKHTSVRYKAFYGTDRYFYGIADKQFKPGDKVRIIIVKEENK